MLIVVWQTHVVVLEQAEASHCVGAASADLGVFALVGYVVVDVFLFPVLQQLHKVGFVLVEHPVSLCADPLQLSIWLDVVGLKVLVETAVFDKGGPVSSVGTVLVKDSAVVLLPGSN